MLPAFTLNGKTLNTSLISSDNTGNTGISLGDYWGEVEIEA